MSLTFHQGASPLIWGRRGPAPNKSKITDLSRRRFLRRDCSVAEFFSKLNGSGCKYVVLRWFEDLPFVPPGEEIDILVEDEQVDTVRQLLVRTPISKRWFGSKYIRIDLYSVSGLPGSTYRGIAHFPPHLARQILERAVRHSSCVMVPCKLDHFRSACFHALYVKGLESGIRVSGGTFTSNQKPGHDYAAALAGLAAELGIDVEIEMNALEEELFRHGWRPPLDSIERLLPDDAWAEDLVKRVRGNLRSPAGLAVFLVRERATADPSYAEAIVEELYEYGFNILANKSLSPEEARRAQQAIRGGNWGRGPWPTSGGGPAVAIVAVDVFPSAPSIELLRHHPKVDNKRVFEAKERIRDLANARLPASHRCNIVHTSDNAEQAALYVSILMPELEDKLMADAYRLTDEVHAEGSVLGPLGGCEKRACVELVDLGQGGLGVRKRFRPGREAYFEKEVRALEVLHPIFPEFVPELLERGKNYIVIPFYKDMRRKKLLNMINLPLPVPVLKSAFVAVKRFYDHGFIMHDFRPHNLIVGPHGNFKFIDFEDTVERTAGEAALDFFALPLFEPDKYDHGWGRAAGASPQSILYDSLWILYLKRFSMGYPRIIWSALRKAGRNEARKYKRRSNKRAARRAAKRDPRLNMNCKEA